MRAHLACLRVCTRFGLGPESQRTHIAIWTCDGTGKIYKMDMDGKVLGMFITGQDHGAEDTGNLVHSLDCRNPNTVFVGSASMWDVQKVTIKANAMPSVGGK